jgi:hypothetical protein
MSGGRSVKRPSLALDSDPDPIIDWAARNDGQTHRLVPGKHFTRNHRLVRRSASIWATRNGRSMSSRLQPDGSILIRFSDPRKVV